MKKNLSPSFWWLLFCLLPESVDGCGIRAIRIKA